LHLRSLLQFRPYQLSPQVLHQHLVYHQLLHAMTFRIDVRAKHTVILIPTALYARSVPDLLRFATIEVILLKASMIAQLSAAAAAILLVRKEAFVIFLVESVTIVSQKNLLATRDTATQLITINYAKSVVYDQMLRQVFHQHLVYDQVLHLVHHQMSRQVFRMRSKCCSATGPFSSAPPMLALAASWNLATSPWQASKEALMDVRRIMTPVHQVIQAVRKMNFIIRQREKRENVANV